MRNLFGYVTSWFIEAPIRGRKSPNSAIAHGVREARPKDVGLGNIAVSRAQFLSKK